jgi:hypothetical protein
MVAGWWKLPVSLLVIAHFCAVGSVVTSMPAPSQPAPLVASTLNQVFRPHLEALFLTGTFRFYAPNPGPISLSWFRIERADGTAEWVEAPLPEASRWNTAYQRTLSQSAFLDMQIGRASDDPARLQLSPLGQICAASFVRYIARYCGEPETIRTVELFSVHHRPLEPSQIAEGWGVGDLRLYRPCCLGRFDVTGKLVDGGDATTKKKFPAAVPSSRLAARMCLDLAKIRSKSMSLSVPPEWPRPFQCLIARRPELLDVAGTAEDDLTRRIERGSTMRSS